MHLTRPASLFPLFASVTTLPGIGARLGAIMEKRIGQCISHESCTDDEYTAEDRH